MIKIRIRYNNTEQTAIEAEKGIAPRQLLPFVRNIYPVYACRIAFRYKRLDEPLTESCTVDFTDLRDPYANMAYQSSLTLLYMKAVHDVLGRDVKITIANSLSRGLFTRIHISSVTDEMTEKIEKRMQELAGENLPVREKELTREQAIEYCRNGGGDKEELHLLETAPDLRTAYLAELEDEKCLFYLHLLPDTGSLQLFELRRYRSGVLLRFPHPSDPAHVPVYQEQKLLYEAFSEESHWQNLMGVRYAADLNDKVLRNDIRDLVMLSEALHEKKIAEIAEEIRASRKRIILIAGPSSSGKTTFAKRLCTQLRVCGLKPMYLGTDDYFLDREDMIPDENGELNFEDLSAVDVKLFESQMNDLLSGKKTDIPEFDFIEGKKIFGKRITSIDSSQPIVIEGIHGLNPELTSEIDDGEKFKIYISPLTQLNIDMHHRVPTTDARMLRRMVRDFRTRGRSARTTIHDWPAVRAGEEKNIFPYNGEADVFFNSQCLYELAVLKKYALPLLDTVTEDMEEYAEANRMRRFLDFFVSIEDDSVISNTSIVREFIGGSIIVS